jgi:hypothetical protein
MFDHSNANDVSWNDFNDAQWASTRGLIGMGPYIGEVGPFSSSSPHHELYIVIMLLLFNTS